MKIAFYLLYEEKLCYVILSVIRLARLKIIWLLTGPGPVQVQLVTILFLRKLAGPRL